MNTRLSRFLFFLFCLFCIAYPIAVIGVAFNVHPPFSMAWSGSALLFLEGTMLAVALMDEYGPPGLLAVLVIAILAYGVEALGVATGFPFGAYRYTDVLFPRLPGGVPLPVIFAWIMIIVAVRGKLIGPMLRLMGCITSLFMAPLLATLLDLEIEPVAFHQEHYWEWLAPGRINYYGIPLLNFVAWFIIALVIVNLVNFILLGRMSFGDLTSFSSSLPLRVPTILYYANVFMFGLIDLTHGYYIAVGFAALAAILPMIKSALPHDTALMVTKVNGVEQNQTFQPKRKRVKKTKKQRKR